MTQTSNTRMLRLVTEPQKLELVPRVYEIELRNRIHQAELVSMQKEQQDIDAGQILYDGPMARLWVPPAPINTCQDQHLGPGELVELWRGNSLVPYQLVRGDATFLSWRRQFEIFKEMLPELKTNPLLVDKKKRWELIYTLFKVCYGVMSMCRSEINHVPHLLCGIRSNKLATRGVGKMSFPAGTVKPFETLETAVRRELLHEGFIRMATSYPGWVSYDFPDAPSLTFGKLMEVKAQDTIPKDGCYEVEGKMFIWIRQADIGAFIAGDSDAVINRFEEHGVVIPTDELGRKILKITDDARIVFGTFIGLGM